MLSERDDLRHPHDSDPRWRESLYWNFVTPDASLGGVVYLRLDPNAGTISPLIFMYRGFEETPAYFYTRTELLRPGAELHSVSAAGFHLERLETLRRYSLAFDDGEGTGFALEFTGIHPAFDYARNRTGCPPTMGSNRFEQAGRLTGVLRLEGKQLEVAGFCQRDHSWGVRDWDSIQHYKWFAVQASEDASVNLFYSIVRGEPALNGYVHDGADVSVITRADIKTTYGEDGISHRQVVASIVDERGKETTLEGSVSALMPLPLDHSIVLEGAGRFVLNGRKATGIAEYLWPASYVEHMRRM